MKTTGECHMCYAEWLEPRTPGAHRGQADDRNERGRPVKGTGLVETVRHLAAVGRLGSVWGSGRRDFDEQLVACTGVGVHSSL